MERDDLEAVWRALADPSRRKILDLLKERPLTTGELCEQFDISRYAVMKHLTILTEAGLVLVRRQGRQRWNHLNAIPLQQIYERWVSQYESRWASALLQFKQKVEGDPPTMSELGQFHIEQEIRIHAPAAKVFQALTQDVAAWWGAPYQLTPNPTALILEPFAGGRLYEEFAQGSASWAVVQNIRQDDYLVLEGRFGMRGAVVNVVTFVVTEQDGGTRLQLSHRAMGEVNDDLAAGYRAGWEDLAGVRLKAFVEEGTRYGLGHEPPFALE